MLKKLIALSFAVSALAASALAAPRVLYASFIPPSAVTGGSIPSLRVVLSDNVATDTTVSLQSDSASLVVPATITVHAGQRYGTVVTGALPVAAATVVHATATLRESSATGTLTIHAAKLLICYFTSGENLTTSWFSGNRIRFNVVLTGPAGPSGVQISPFADQPLGAIFAPSVTIPAGQRYYRFAFVTPNVPPISGTAGAQLADGSSVSCPFQVNNIGLFPNLPIGEEDDPR
jgi:hypothetical protein